MSDLLPCPFCNCLHAPGVLTINVGHSGGYHHVVCNTNYAGCGAQGAVASTPEHAIAAWNRRAHADPALLALAKLGAWVAQSHADEPGDVFAPDIEDAEDKFGVVVTHRPPVGHCALGGERGDDCPCSEYYGRDEQCECRLFAPGIADAIARLLAPDGAGEVTG